MNTVHPEYPDPQSATVQSEPLLKFAMANSAALKKAFYNSLERRCDPEAWERLGNSVAVLLEGTRLASQELGWFLETDRRLLTSVTDFIARSAPNTTRARYYRRAAGELESAGLGGPGMDQAAMAYWRHAALVWMSLWHLADIPQLAADDTEKCLGLALKLESDPAPSGENLFQENRV